MCIQSTRCVGVRDATDTQLALIQWKTFVLAPVQQDGRLTHAVLDQIRDQRNGHVVQSTLLKTVLDSYVSLGIDDADATKINLDVYRNDFQQAFLDETLAYYKRESADFISTNSITDYMKKVESRLREEDDRVELYLHASTRRPLMDVCQDELLVAHNERLRCAFAQLLEDEMTVDLARMYALLAPVADGLDPLRARFEEYVREAGLNSVSKAVGEAGDAIDPPAYVHALLEVYSQSLDTIHAAFQGEAGFIAALDKACRVFMNKNQATGASASKSPELLAKYVDGLLKKSHKGGEETSVDDLLERAMSVFKYIEDRDYFQRFYTKFLARRLVTFASASDDAEAAMISKLKEVCGFEYTSKLQRMFTEVGLSRELNERFRDFASNEGGETDVSFNALVLANGIWPLQPPSTSFSVPSELLPTYEQFRRFYSSEYSRRVLTWLWHLSSNEVHTTHLPRKYILQTTSYQCAVLLLFNSQTVLTFDEIAETTKLDHGPLHNTLLPLVKSKLLHQLDNSYSLNMGASQVTTLLTSDFKSKKMRVNLQIPVRAEQKTETSEVMRNVDEDRKVLLQASIVRIMKSRKTLKHNLLLPEVIAQVKTRFQPKVSDIKKVRQCGGVVLTTQAIDALIEKDFLVRSEEEKDLCARRIVTVLTAGTHTSPK